MITRSIKTDKVLPGSTTVYKILDQYLSSFNESSILAVTSKIISLCETRVLPVDGTEKTELVINESEYYLPAKYSNYGFQFSITGNTLIPAAGIDESNTNGNYLLWPQDPQKSANQIRAYLLERFGVKKAGVVITDSTCQPLRWGTTGIALAYSGFKPTNNYIGKSDLFGREFKVSRAGIASGLAASAVLTMGEGSEQTPLAVIEEVPFVSFVSHDPTKEELEEFYIRDFKEDLFAPFFDSVAWQKGKSNGNR
jgi:F420-0:gamma-glutamyl ligase